MSTDVLPCGFECLFSKKTDVWNFLTFSALKLDHFYFKVVDAAVFLCGRRIEILDQFLPSYLHELNQMSLAGERLVLHLYPENTSYVEIDNYKEFQKSECEMIILLYDFYYIEIYCKNQVWLQKMMHEVISTPGAVIDEKYEDNDPRTVMYV